MMGARRAKAEGMRWISNRLHRRLCPPSPKSEGGRVRKRDICSLISIRLILHRLKVGLTSFFPVCKAVSTHRQDGEDYENWKSRTGPQWPIRRKKSYCHA
ncbi:hypothetical protein KM043_016001 [Ampulex compressa]|nr:hypothetical protein KM043_016001 [Ampulex compressa]